MGGIIAWPKDSDPSTSSNIWLECNGQSFDTSRFKKLYKVLGSNKVPNFQGMFLRGAGSQSFSQDNGDFSSNSTNYSAGNIGQIQGDSMRRLYGGGGPFAFIDGGAGAGIYGNFMKSSGAGGQYELGMGGHAGLEFIAKIPVKEYHLNGSGGDYAYYSLSSSTSYVEVPTFKSGSGSSAQASRWVGWDSSYASPTDNEIRPVNIAVKYYIRAK